MKILLVEDDPDTRQLLALHLTAARYTVEQATDGITALELMLQWSYDLIILDLNLPQLDGLSLCRQLRLRGTTTPILILTATTGHEHIITGLDAGADDYVTKPFEVQSVLARVRALLRRGITATEIPSFVWGGMRLNPAIAEVTYDGQVIPLTPKEYTLLELFLRHPQRIFSRSNILDHVWTIEDSPTEGAVTNLVKDLRSRLKRSGVTEMVIQTVYGLGYRLGDPSEFFDSEEARELAIHSYVPSYAQDRSLSSLGSLGSCPPTPTEVSVSPGAAKGLADLAQRFQASLPNRLTRLGQALDGLQRSELTQLDRHQAAEEAHRLAGGLGTFGSLTGLALARRIENLLRREDPLTPDQIDQVTEAFQRLQEEIDLGRWRSHGLSQSWEDSLGTTIPPGVTLNRRLLLVNVDRAMAELLQQRLPLRGYIAEVYATLPDLGTTPLQPQVGAILLGLDPMANPTAKLAPLEDIRRYYPQMPVLVITCQDSLEERVQVARLQGNCYLVAPISTNQLLEALDQVLPSPQPPESRVLVVDTDPATLVTIEDLLSPWGLQVFGLKDPRQFWEQLREIQPDLLLLALDIPTFSGFDLCQVVRQDPTYGNLPTLMLAAQPDTITVNQVFEAGGDDLIGKPIVGPELVARVLSRIERSRLRQQLHQMRQQRGVPMGQFAYHDPLTQLAHGSHLETFLQQQWDRHYQDRSPLALILCNLDDFAAYQQTYGQAASQEVLRRIARALHRTINPNLDLVARSGETQFSILLPNTNLDGALRVATRIQQAMDDLKIPHGSNQRHRYLTFSLGIGGTIPTQNHDSRQLLEAAHQALREAEARGGNTLSLYPISW